MEPDISSFPLLRIDQIPIHTTETLKESEKQLILIELEKSEDVINSIAPFVSKLLHHIRRELADRRGSKYASGMPCRSTPPRKLNTSWRRVTSSNNPSSCKKLNSSNASPAPTKQPPPLSFFVPNSPNASSFRSRSKQADRSIQARSQDAIDREREELRRNSRRKALEKMQEWRMGRELSKKQREKLLEEERKALRLRRMERRKREDRVRISMHTAAAIAKEKALQSGSSPEEAILDAAAAAAKVVDDQSTVFHESNDGDSDVDSADLCNDKDDNCEAIALPTDVLDTSFDVENDAPLGSNDEVCDEAISHANDRVCNVAHPTDVLDTSFDTENHAPLGSNDDVCDEVIPHVGKNDDDIPMHSIFHFEDDLIDKEDRLQCNDASIKEPAATGTDDETINVTSELQLPTTEYAVVNDQPEAEQLEHADNLKEDSPSESLTAKTFVEPTTSLERVEPEHPDPSLEVELEVTHTPLHPRPRSDNLFSKAFPSFQHIFSQFETDRRVKVDDKALIKCMQAQIDRCSDLEMFDDDEPELFYHIKSNRQEVVDIISRCFSDRTLSQWEEATDCALWNLLWTWGMPKAANFEHLLVFQKISRFRQTRGLTRKDLLKKNIQRCLASSDKDGFNIMPLTYALPHEYNAFVKGFASMQNSSNQSNFWIVKPIGLSRGRGISLVNNVSDVSYSQPIVIQKYIADPLCYMGYKFDLRVYVLVTSFSPLEAFVYREGLARFGSRKYSASLQNLHDLRIHLTNSSIQKEFECEVDKGHPAYFAGSSGAESKVALTWLWKRLDELGVDSKMLWKRVVDVCLKTLVAGGSDIPCQPNSFELFGFDVMFDANLKCWLIEVNSSPSMSCDSSLDTRIKGNLIRDTVALVDPLPINQRALVDVCARRLSRRKEVSDRSSGTILEQDLRRIMNGRLPRGYGELPTRLGGFERIAPGSEYDQLIQK